ncbi:MAG TPA: CHAD domain-containing protein [Anaeromyxobacteraceae bacterium]|nr:CHAD domain-containing protein [Anaeromyxobacteraceae bacterium]
MRLRASELDLPATAGARAMAAALLRDAVEELGRLEAAGDQEALHDFRVSLRRLRSVARALRPQLAGSLRKRHERLLRQVARATTEARDAEVQIAWLAQERPVASPREQPGIEWLSSRLEGRLREAQAGDLRATAARFRRLAGKMAKALAAPATPLPGQPSLGSLLADLLRSHAAGLNSALDAVGGPMEVEPAHAARIAGKRLRYLLEPLRGSRRADSAPAVAILKELQDVLGELHDAHVAADTVAAAMVETASGRARATHAAVLEGDAAALRGARRDPLLRGLLRLDRRCLERATAAHGRLVQEWRPARQGALLEAVAGVAARLTASGTRRPGRRRRTAASAAHPHRRAQPAARRRGPRAAGSRRARGARVSAR